MSLQLIVVNCLGGKASSSGIKWTRFSESFVHFLIFADFIAARIEISVIVFTVNACLASVDKIAAWTRWIEFESNRHIIVTCILPTWVITILELAWWWLTFGTRSWGWIRAASTDDSGDLIPSWKPIDYHFVLAVFITIATISESLSSWVVETMVITNTNGTALRVTCGRACITGLSICETVSVAVIGETSFLTVCMSQTIQLNYATFWFCFWVSLFDEWGAASVVVLDSVVLTLAQSC